MFRVEYIGTYVRKLEAKIKLKNVTNYMYVAMYVLTIHIETEYPSSVTRFYESIVLFLLSEPV